MTLAAPQWFHLRHGEHSYPKDVYANDNEYFADIAKAYREELADLYDAGCRNVQFDDPLLAYFVSLFLAVEISPTYWKAEEMLVVVKQCSEAMLSGMKAEGVESEPILDAYIKLYNDCIRDVPKDMTVGVHLCRSVSIPFSSAIFASTDYSFIPLSSGNFKDGYHFSPTIFLWIYVRFTTTDEFLAKNR